MIFETIVSTTGVSGGVNFAPMGIVLEGERLLLRPFRDCRTWANLQEIREGVVNFTDNVLLFARCAVSSHVPPHRPALAVRGFVLEDVCYWKEFKVETVDLSEERGRFLARIVREGRERDFMGFNRGRHAVIEASIAATRLNLLGLEKVLEEFARLRPLVDKTGGAMEREAFDLLDSRVRETRRAG